VPHNNLEEYRNARSHLFALIESFVFRDPKTPLEVISEGRAGGDFAV
jgi:hypothetical protein